MNKLFRVFVLVLLGISISLIRPTAPIAENPNQTLESSNSINKINELFEALEKYYLSNRNYQSKSLSIRDANNEKEEKKAVVLRDIIRFAQNGLSDKMADFFLDEIKDNKYKEISQFIQYIQGLESIDIQYFVNLDFETNLLNLYQSNNNKSEILKSIIEMMYKEMNYRNLPIYPPIIKTLFVSDNPEKIINDTSLKMIRAILAKILRKEKFYKDKQEAGEKLTIDDAKRYLGKLFFTFYMDLVIIKLSSLNNKSAQEDIKRLAEKFLTLISDKTVDEKMMYTSLRNIYNIPSNNLVKSVDQPIDPKVNNNNQENKIAPKFTISSSVISSKSPIIEPVEFGAT